MLLCGRSVGQSWKWQSRLDFSWVHDDNVFESLTGTNSDHSGRVLADFYGRGSLFKPVLLSLRYQCGLEGYSQYRVENRVINDGEVIFEVPIHRFFSFGTTLQGKAKTFFQTTRGYGFYQLSPFIKWISPKGLRGSLFYSYSLLDYRQGFYFDVRNQSGGFFIEYQVMPEITLDFRWTIGAFQYERHSFTYILLDTSYQWMDLGVQQNDQYQVISTQLEIYKWALMRIGFSCRWNDSNSYGYGYACPEIRIIMAKSFPWDLTLRFYWSHRWKKYTDTLEPLLQIRPDTENEESSFTVLDISKDIMAKSSFRIRLGWYRNESPFRDRYYTKNLFSIGFTQRF